MTEKNSREADSAAPETAKKWWCNFCDFRSDDEKEYLNHSCKDELAKKKQSAPAP
ncbi:MAG: hypothetical protein LC772_00530 [Chloroflexi bacterium]|nr:hypothetical protein [Chloroflexota bacterium]